ncbi:winged helix-turn-helix domain-containing protein, partial [Lentzea sp. NPDC060358]|uniref:winged helix-turn-helix domain-containing protein n=1 Tax=Lentzea sp. NPDC060358 TaxID=3347103 RepID=UPI00364B40B9
MTTPESVVRALAEPARLRAYAAVVLGAGTLADIAASAGLKPKDAGTALRKLREAGLVEGDPARPADLTPLATT